MTHKHRRLITIVEGKLIGTCRWPICPDRVREYPVEPEPVYGGRKRVELVESSKLTVRRCSGCGKAGHTMRYCVKVNV